ncbi:MAG: glycosyltransferase [Solirubrobacteraceae bacterium]
MNQPAINQPVATEAPGQSVAERITLAHDYLLVMRGAERTFAAMTEVYSEAPIYTLLYDEPGTSGRFADRSITTSRLQRLGVGQANFRRLFPMYPRSVERLELPESDVVLSSSSAFAHGVRAPEGSIHVCYCYTPFRYAWYEEDRALSETAAPLRPLLRAQLRRMRDWDLRASQRVDAYIAISELSRRRIKRYYDRDAPIVHPPVETHRFGRERPEDKLLVVSELVRHKRVDIALEAARRARAPIRVVGSGPDFEALRAAYPEAEFLGRLDDRQLVELYSAARAVVVPSMEEFGITIVEAQAAGRPVIAAAAGGALETVLEGRTGALATLDDVDAFQQAIQTIDELDFEPAYARTNAMRFSVSAFQTRLSALVNQAVELGQEFSGRWDQALTSIPSEPLFDEEVRAARQLASGVGHRRRLTGGVSTLGQLEHLVVAEEAQAQPLQEIVGASEGSGHAATAEVKHIAIEDPQKLHHANGALELPDRVSEQMQV